MNMAESPAGDALYQRRLRPRLAIMIGGTLLAGVVLAVGVVIAGLHSVGEGEFLVLVNKTGRLVPDDLADEFADQVVLYPALVRSIAAKTNLSEDEVRAGYKGIRYEMLREGWHWINPYSNRAVLMKATYVAQDEIGVKIRRYGKPLAHPKTVATRGDERGPVAEPLKSGRHNINLLAYEVMKFPVIRIPEGHVGVVTLLSGREPKEKNTYTVAEGEKGVQQGVLPPGVVRENPFLKYIEIVDVRSHKYDMLGADAIHFPSNDSFDISMEGTIEWAIRPDRVAEVTVAYGDKTDILNKIILPNTRSIARIQGSKLQAREFISGKTRIAFQDNLLEELRRDCGKQGIEIKAALVRDIQPPAEIASLISQREQADQEMERSANQKEEAKAEALLVEQLERQGQNASIGDARRDVVTVTKEAEQRKVVSVTMAKRELEVAKLTLQAAAKEASATVARGEAKANVVRMEYVARAEPLKAAVNAFGDGETYAQLFFLEKIAPSIKSILSNTEGPFADIFKQFQMFPTTGNKGGEG